MRSEDTPLEPGQGTLLDLKLDELRRELASWESLDAWAIGSM